MSDANRLIIDTLPAFATPLATPPATFSPGGKALPSLGGTPAAQAPILTAVSEMTYPDETLAIVGEDLTDATLLLWTEGQLEEVHPLRSDRTKMQAVVPADRQTSVTLLWPKNEQGIGRPFRVNAPQIYWCNRASLPVGHRGEQLRLFGSCLTLGGRPPLVIATYPNGTSEQAVVIDHNPYALTVELQTPLADGETCRIAVHNGTGGIYGWSEPLTLAAIVSSLPAEADLPHLFAEDFGARAEDGFDNADALERMLDEAAALGGAVILLSQGEYQLSRTLEITDRYPNGLVLRGLGRGTYDFDSHLLPSEYEHRGLSGRYTALRFLDPHKAPEHLLRILSRHVTLCDMTLYGADGHVGALYTMTHGHTVHVEGSDIHFDSLRFLKADLRDLSTDPKDRLMCSNHIYLDRATSEVTVRHCEFHTKACAIWLNHYHEYSREQSYLFDDSLTVRHVVIADNDFYNYTHPYVHPSGRKPMADEGEVSRGITAMNCDDLIVERNHFRGFDQKNDFVLTRTMYLPITDNHMYIANNLMWNVGSTPGTGFDGNTGEQILFHGGMHLGGVYEVKHCEGTVLTVRTDNIRLKDHSGRFIKPDTVLDNSGSRIQPGLERGKRGMAFLCGGKGIGQIRQIDAYEVREGETVFHLHEPFLIDPDTTSTVVETAPFRENIVYKNTIMKEEPTMAQGFKSGGILLFFDSHRNIIAENDFRNLAFGVALNSAFKAPLSWNTVRDNTFTGIREAYRDAMQGGDSTRHSTFFCESTVGNAGEFSGWDTYSVWYTLGNVFRANRCYDGDTAAELATNRWHLLRNIGHEHYFGEEKGNALTIIENNHFADVSQGILIGNPAYWSLLRNNTLSFKKKEGFLANTLCHDHAWTNFKLLHIEDDEIKKDDNNTCRS